MFISIIGPDGVGKNLIAKHLSEKLKFTWIKEPYPKESEREGVAFEFFHLNARAKIQIGAKQYDEDVVTIRSVFDSFDIYAELSYRMEKITETEKLCIQSLKKNFSQLIPTPEAVIFVKSSKINQIARLQERGDNPLPEYLKWQDELYGAFLEEIAVPIIEIDAARAGDFYSEVDFSIESFKTSRVSTRTIWRREFYK